MSVAAAPEEQKVWSGSLDQQPQTASDVSHAPATADPLDRVASNDDPNEFHAPPLGAKEEVENTSLHRDSSREYGRTNLDRTESNWTDVSVSTSAPSHVQPATPPKRSFWNKINPLKSKVTPPVPTLRQVSREYKASFLSKLTFQWMAPLMHVGYQRTLEVNDIWLVNPDRAVDVLADKLSANFKKRVAAGRVNPLRWALYDTFKFEFVLGGACEFTVAICQAVNPFILRYLIEFATKAYLAANAGGPAPPVGHGIGLVIAVTVINVIQSTGTHQFLYRGMTCGGQSRAAMIALIFDKAMTVSNRAKAGYSPPRTLPADLKPGSESEKKWFAKMLPQKKKKDTKKTAADNQDKSWDNGRITNLMSVDTYRIDLASGFFHMCWTSPITILIVLILLLVNLTYSALAGFGLLIISTPLLGMAVGSLMKRRKQINVITDERVSLITEILKGVKFVKFFAAETSFLERLNQIRRREISKIQMVLTIRNAIMAVGMSMPTFASMLAFITYNLTHHGLAAANIFSSLALFNALRLPLNLLPMVLGQIVDALASMQRIEEFLLLEDALDEAEWDHDRKEAIVVQNAAFTWEKSPARVDAKDDKKAKAGKDGNALTKTEDTAVKSNKLRYKFSKKNTQTTAPGDPEKVSHSVTSGTSSSDTTLANTPEKTLSLNEDVPFGVKINDVSIGRDELVAVIGKTGSGKSSFLSALAGDMRRTQGSVVLGSSRAFCPQVAWILNATVRENVVFGKEFKRGWYNEVVDACALRPDLDMLPAGDATEVGEKGITVSGGQKQRINLARAIYFDADIVLLDDPLSAVDPHVGKHIMDNAICGLLQGKCRILATNQLHVLHRCDRIIWLDEGLVKSVGTFDELMARDEEFQTLLANTASNADITKTDEESEEEVADVAKEAKKKSKTRKAAKALMQDEERATDSVAWSVYSNYIKASGSWLAGPLVFLLLVVSQGATIVTSLWLSFWTSDKFGFSVGQYIGIYAALGFVQAVLMFAFSVSVTVIGTRSSQTMLNRAMSRVLRAPQSFFDTTPLGRITNRFSRDVDTMDNVLTDSYRMFLMTSANIIAVLILIIAYFYYFVVALVPLVILFFFSTTYYRASAREMKRHEAVLRSVVFSRFGEAISGVSTIRAYGLQKHFSSSVREAIDGVDGPQFLTYSNQRWLGTRLDAIGSLMVFVTGILVVTSRFTISPSISGLVLSYILSIVQFLQFSVRQMAEVENNMNATERLNHYGTELEEEAPLHTIPIEASWPSQGEIVFDHVDMRYRAGLPLVLKDLSMHVKAGERIGFVGRTGAGKSSIMTTLFRITELSGGSITIDGHDIAKVGLADLRSKLGIIPQDPVLFKGTIRYNLDPFNRHSDLELWTALRQADLVGEDQNLEDRGSNIRIHLDTPVEDEGFNFSNGQRQLLALARALAARSRILVCDEATGSIDEETDRKIQLTMLQSSKGKTLLCIAHRLKTILSYDRICVMDAGRILELDSPETLFRRQNSAFRGMCEASGVTLEAIQDSMSERLQVERLASNDAMAEKAALG